MDARFSTLEPLLSSHQLTFFSNCGNLISPGILEDQLVAVQNFCDMLTACYRNN